MKSWADLAAAEPDLAAFGTQRLQRRIAYLATTRLDGSPRVHPVCPVIVGNRLFVYMEPTSPKVTDLRRDPRYALHCTVEDSNGGQGEFVVRGRAVEVGDTIVRREVFEFARTIGYEPLERYVLFEFTIEEAMATVYPEGEPNRTMWKAL